MTADACWIVGPVTADLFEDGRRIPGGSVSYAARVAAAFGLRACVLTAVGPDADLGALEGHELQVLPARTQTFAHAFPDGRRRLTVVAWPGRTLAADDAPAGWAAPGTLLLAPLLPDDIDLSSFLDRYPAAEVALLAQGLQRDTDAEGVVRHLHAPSPALLEAVRANVTVFLSEEETAGWPAGALAALAGRARRVVLTRGALGAAILVRGEVIEVPAAPADPVDPTGAGDVFATAFILGVRAGDRAAGRLAAAMAAAAVMVRGPAPLPARAAIESRLVAPDPGGDAPDEGPSA